MVKTKGTDSTKIFGNIFENKNQDVPIREKESTM